jgi:alkaline phosphatase D
MAMRILQISDTHLSARHDAFRDNAEAFASWVASQDADLVVHSGDLAMDGAGDAADLHHSMDWIRSLDREVLIVPGNHDVGDTAAIRPDQTVDDARLATWRDIVGPDRWVRDIAGWRLIGLNAMLLGSGHAEEEHQFDWLAEALDHAGPMALVLHKPLFIDHPDEEPRGYWTVLPEPRRRILSLMAGRPVQLVASGHLHIRRALRRGAVDHVWGPASSFVVGAMQEDLGGERLLGAVGYDLAADAASHAFLRPDGLREHLIDPVVDVIYRKPAAGTAA